MKKSTKILSLIFAVMMVFTMIPMNIFATTLAGEDNSQENTQNQDQDTTEEIVIPDNVAEECVAIVDGKEYASFVEALNAVNENGGILILCKDVKLAEKITIKSAVKIVGEYTITRDESYLGTLFVVNADASLTLDGGLTIDGGNDWSFDKEAYEQDLYALNRVTSAFASKYFTVDENAPVANAYMISVSGALNLFDITIKNHYSINSGIVNASNGANVTLEGAYITHCASVTGGGLVVNAVGSKYEPESECVKVTMNDGTVIDGNHVGSNHGIFKVYIGTTFTMNGGEIKNTTGCNSNGVVVGIYWAKFVMNGGKICSNSSVYGSNNGRNSSIYAHSASYVQINGGSICHNVGASRGGIDAPYTDQEGNASNVTVNDGEFLYNVSVAGHSTHDINGGDRLVINGGTFSQDVSRWMAGSNAMEKNEDGTYTVSSKVEPTIKDVVINLNKSLEIKFIIGKGNAVDGYYVVVIHENAEELRKPLVELDQEGNAYVIACTDIAAKEMVDKTTVMVYNGNDEIVSSATTSIRDYAMSMLETTDNDSLKTLIVDTLNYGAATQEYLGYKTDDLANAYLTEEQKAYATEYVQNALPLPIYENKNLFGTSLSVRDTFTLKFYFKNITADMTATISMSDGTVYTIDGSAFKNYKNGIMIIDVDGFTVYEAGEMIECTVTDADGNVVATASQSIANYLVSMIRKNPENSVYEYILKYILAGNMYEE